MEVLLGIYEQRSISRAAQLMGVDQSTLSRRLTALEAQLGQKLFARSKTGAHPTSLAESLVPMARQMRRAMTQVEGVVQVHEHELRGLVRLALPDFVTQFVLVPRLEDLLTRYPGLELQLHSGAQVANMKELEADLAVRLVKPSTGELTVQRLFSSGLSIVGHTRYLGPRMHTPLDQLQWIGWTSEFDGLYASRWLRERGLTARLRFNRILPMLEAARSGLGVGLFGGGMKHLFPDLMERPHPSLVAARADFWLVRPAVHQDNPLVNAVAQWLQDSTRAMSSE